MRTWSPAFTALMQGNAATIAVCWRVSKNDGTFVYGTQHDEDITITGGLYAGTYESHAGISGSDIKSQADMSVDNVDVDGAEPDPSDTTTVDINHDDIAADNFAYAPVVMFLTDWTNPSDYQHVLGWGTLGEITEESTGHYKTEVRAPAQAFQQQIIRAQSDRCDIPHLGHGQCQFDIAGATVTGTVTAVTDRKTFEVTTTPTLSSTFGLLTWTSGENEGFAREVALDPRENTDNPGVLVLFDEMPEDIAIGDAYSLEPGCPRTIGGCQQRDQVINFQGYGLFCPGIDAYIKGAL